MSITYGFVHGTLTVLYNSKQYVHDLEVEMEVGAPPTVPTTKENGGSLEH